MDKKIMFKQLDQTGRDLCQQFQLGYEAQANNTLTDFLDLLILFIEEKKLSENKELNDLFTIMLSAQQRHDVLFLSDIISYVLLPKLANIP